MNILPFAAILVSIVTIAKLRRYTTVLLPLAVTTIGVGLWQIACDYWLSETNPSPMETLLAIFEIHENGRLWSDAAASLFRVTWGFFLAAAVGIPLGLWVGWTTRGFEALNPIIQALRPISPIAWIPFAILWFGIGDGAGIFLIFYASFFPITVGTMAAVRNISMVHQRSAMNFGLHGIELFRRVVFPAALPQIITSLRIALGVAWLVIVAAEMVGMDSGLGYLINDARNMGRRYDLVAATMVIIGAIGVVLDLLIRRLENFDEVRWGYVKR
jgi:NitT/TauT family transport system permease protein